MLNDLWFRMTKRVFEAQWAHFETSRVKIKQCTSEWGRRLKKLNPRVVSAVNELTVLREYLNRLLASLGEEANWGSQVETGPADETKMKSPGADGPAGHQIKCPGVNNPSGDNSEVKQAEDTTPGADN